MGTGIGSGTKIGTRITTKFGGIVGWTERLNDSSGAIDSPSFFIPSSCPEELSVKVSFVTLFPEVEAIGFSVTTSG